MYPDLVALFWGKKKEEKLKMLVLWLLSLNTWIMNFASFLLSAAYNSPHKTYHHVHKPCFSYSFIGSGTVMTYDMLAPIDYRWINAIAEGIWLDLLDFDWIYLFNNLLYGNIFHGFRFCCALSFAFSSLRPNHKVQGSEVKLERYSQIRSSRIN